MYISHTAAAFSRVQSRMSTALATGVSTGTSLAVFWRLFEGLQSTGPNILCPARSWLELHWPSLLLGLFIGLCLGPILEAVVGLRLLLYQAAFRRLLAGLPQPAQRPLHRLL